MISFNIAIAPFNFLLKSARLVLIYFAKYQAKHNERYAIERYNVHITNIVWNKNIAQKINIILTTKLGFKNCYSTFKIGI